MVQWYMWPINIPQDCFYDNVIFDFDLDVIEDLTIKNPIIKIDNMVASCQVIYGVSCDLASDVMTTAFQDHQIDKTLFLCKYRLIEFNNCTFLEQVTCIPNVEILVLDGVGN